MASNNQEDFNEDYENQIINEEYKIWKKNAPFLYDMVITHVLEWPSLTIEWLPVKDNPPDSDYSLQKLILGTHTSGEEPNHLLIAKVRLPLEETVSNVTEYVAGNKELGGIGTASNENRVEIETRIVHEGEINRARYMPQKYNIIATKTVSGEVHVFDYTQHPTKPENETVSKPQLRLTGHKDEGYGLAWSHKKLGYILSGSQDNKVCLWNIEGATQLNSSMPPLMEFTSHTAGVEDVSWHYFSEDVFASVSSDKTINLWDLRQKSTNPTHVVLGHSAEIYTIDFSPYKEHLFLTGSADKDVGFWDIRNVTKRLHTFQGHSNDVLKVQWAPFNQTIFGSCSSDRRLIVWDTSKIGEEQRAEDAQDGPPEMLFIHGGHRAKIPDFSWDQNETLVCASVEEENNILQIWQMAYNIYQDDDNNINEELKNDIIMDKK